MAVYKGREVTIIGKTGGEDTAPLYTIQHKDGNREDVKLNQIQVTEKELKDARDGSQWHLNGAQVIKDKDLQDLRDSQDVVKIEERQKKNPTSTDVEVSKIKVDSEELNRVGFTNKPVVKK